MKYEKLDRDATLDVLFNEDSKYLIEEFVENHGWCVTDNVGEVILRRIQLYGIEYRYKLKPLEPARVTKKMLTRLIYINSEEQLVRPISAFEHMYNRKVEIID